MPKQPKEIVNDFAISYLQAIFNAYKNSNIVRKLFYLNKKELNLNSLAKTICEEPGNQFITAEQLNSLLNKISSQSLEAEFDNFFQDKFTNTSDFNFQKFLNDLIENTFNSEIEREEVKEFLNQTIKQPSLPIIKALFAVCLSISILNLSSSYFKIGTSIYNKLASIPYLQNNIFKLSAALTIALFPISRSLKATQYNTENLYKIYQIERGFRDKTIEKREKTSIDMNDFELI
ncbi:MAG: hypothetical protein J0H68_03705 [Sphingobacteriia bacterium]|nr:hypothetical protein [Sphingobacteriia bacterium]